jgi:hypothetical protein
MRHVAGGQLKGNRPFERSMQKAMAMSNRSRRQRATLDASAL